MSIKDFCEFIKKIHVDPFARINDLTVGDYYALQKHLDECNNCDTLVTETLEKHKDYKPDPNHNDGRFN